MVVVIDGKRTPVPSGAIERAVSRFVEKEQDLLLSISEVTEHPAQLNTPYLVHDLDLLTLKNPRM